MKVEEAAVALISLIYDAALAPDKWQAFMARIADMMGSHSALLRENGHAAGQVGIFETVGYDPAYVAAYREHFVHLDHFLPILAEMPIGDVKTGEQALRWEQQRNTEFHNDYMRPMGNRHVLGSILARDDRYQVLFALQRGERNGEFNAEELRLIRLITPHMARAAQIHRRLSTVTIQKQWAWSALDRLRVGVIILDEMGKPLFLNHEAERLASISQEFVVGREGLSLSTATDSARLQRMIADAAMLAVGRGVGTDACLRVGATKKPSATLQFQVIPLPRNLSAQPWEQSLNGGCVAVFVSSTSGPRLSYARIMAVHGFTRAEARLAALLAEGTSLEGAAEALSISISTVRTQLKSVFSKTGVTRQAELVALLLADMLNDHSDAPSEIRQ